MAANSRRAGVLAGLVWALTAASLVNAAPTVILLSWDGVRPDQLDRNDLPALARVRREGARAQKLIPPFPSSTFSGHATLATGTYPDRHGIVANRFFDPARRAAGEPDEFDYDNHADWFEAEPLWVAAERQGIRSAVFFWVGSETDWRGQGASLRKAPFNSRTPERTKVDQILAWLDLPQDRRPQLILSYWRGSDHAGHRYGPRSGEVARALRQQDAQLAHLLAGLDARNAWPSTTLLIVSDHGMIEVSEAIDARSILERAGVAARVIPASALAHIHLRDPSDEQAMRRAIEALSQIEGVTAYASDRLPGHLRYSHPSRVGQVVAITTPPRVFRSGVRGLAERASRALGGTTGAHGFDPAAVPEMGGIFLALGRGVGRGVTLPPARAIDLAPTASALLGIEPPADSEGRAIDLSSKAPRSR